MEESILSLSVYICIYMCLCVCVYNSMPTSECYFNLKIHIISALQKVFNPYLFKYCFPTFFPSPSCSRCTLGFLILSSLRAPRYLPCPYQPLLYSGNISSSRFLIALIPYSDESNIFLCPRNF